MSTITTTNSINSASVRFTRNDYMSNCCSHAEYYGQFDSPAVRNAILRVIPMSDLMTSTDPHMNDIKLSRWDAIRLPKETRCKLSVANGHETSIVYSHSDVVCLAKTVAKLMIAEQLVQSN